MHLNYKFMKEIRLFLTDVDGTLTDGGMYYSANGDALKRFYVRDGMGMKLLQQSGVKIGIVTSETTPIVEVRAKKLGVDFLCKECASAVKYKLSNKYVTN